MSTSSPPTLSLEFFLPYGELLRIFLDQRTITSTEIRAVLRGRGIFLSDYEKPISVPHLAFATVTPDEFALLLEKQKVKEDAQKTVHKVIPWISTRTIEEAIGRVDVLEKLLEKNQTCRITSKEPPRKVDGDSNHYVIKFMLARNDFHKSWVNDVGPHPGEVSIKKIGTGSEAKISIVSTIPETKGVCGNIVKNLTQSLKANGYIPPNEEDKSIQFASFDNAGRVKFLASFTRTDSKELAFESMTDAVIELDKSSALPLDIKPLFDNVRQMSLRGEDLQESALLTDVKYHDFIILSEIVIKYRFTYHAAKGMCSITYGFSNNRGRDWGDFEVVQGAFSIDPEFKHVNKAEVKRYVHGLVDDLAFSRSQAIRETIRTPSPSLGSSANGVGGGVAKRLEGDSFQSTKRRKSVKV